MPPRRQKASAQQPCAYREGRRRCGFVAEPGSDYCRPHGIALQEAARPKTAAEVIGGALRNYLSGKPINVEQTIGSVVSAMGGQWAGMADDYRPPITGNERTTHRDAQRGRTPLDPFWWEARTGGQQQHPPPAVDPLIAERRKARLVMQFAENEKLTPEIVLKRRRTLAKRHHPDRGGSTKKMAEIMAAADVLLEEVK